MNDQPDEINEDGELTKQVRDEIRVARHELKAALALMRATLDAGEPLAQSEAVAEIVLQLLDIANRHETALIKIASVVDELRRGIEERE